MAGAKPSFSEVHVVRTLIALSEGNVGRKKLVGVVGVGEGSVRTILKKLSADGLIESFQTGQILSKAGEKKVGGLLELFTKPVCVDLPQLSDYSGQVAVVVRKAAGAVGSAVSLRDVALRNGADGALILVSEGGRLRYPGDVMDERVPEVSGVDFSEGDVVVVGFSSTVSSAEDGALSVALKLVEVVL